MMGAIGPRDTRARSGRGLLYHRSRGSSGIVVVLAVLAVALGMALVTVTIEAAVGTARAQSAADAVALAAAAVPPGGNEVAQADAVAAAVASANGVTIVGLVRRGDCVEVHVARGRADARARAIAGRGESAVGYNC